MKKIIFLAVMIQGVFVFSQNKTVVTMYGEKVTINPYVNNGLTANNGYIQLGGALTQPSVLTTTSAFTLALKGLQTGAAADNLVVTDANGVLKTITKDALSSGITKGSLLSTNGTIAITGGTNKLFDSDAIIDIKPGASNTALTTNSAGKVVWSASLPWILDGNNNGAVRSIGTNDNFDLPIKTNNVERMRVTSTGQVLVNTATALTGGANTKLQINNGTTAGALQIKDGTQAAGRVLTSDANGVGTWQPNIGTQTSNYKSYYCNIGSDLMLNYGVSNSLPGIDSYTAPNTGKYELIFHSFFVNDGSVAENKSFYVQIFINGVLFSSDETYYYTAAGGYLNIHYPAIFQANAGDVVTLKIAAVVGAPLRVSSAFASRNRLDVIFLGV